MYGLIDVIDYIKSCLFSKHGLHVANKVNLEVSEIDGKGFNRGNITWRFLSDFNVIKYVE